MNYYFLHTFGLSDDFFPPEAPDLGGRPLPRFAGTSSSFFTTSLSFFSVSRARFFGSLTASCYDSTQLLKATNGQKINSFILKKLN